MNPEDVPYQYEVNQAISLLSDLVEVLREIKYKLGDIQIELRDINP